jgi:hypothetical protein
MIDQLTAGFTHVIVGGIAANLLVIFSLVSVAAGGEGSRISPDRRLPNDSDAQLFCLLFCIGAACGIAVATAFGFSAELLQLAATAGVSFVAGLITALPRVSKLNEAYLERAVQNLEEGRAKEALEDASEVARSSERLRGKANQIIDMAREMRASQPIEALLSR